MVAIQFTARYDPLKMRRALLTVLLLTLTPGTAHAAYLKADTARKAIRADLQTVQDDPGGSIVVGACLRRSAVQVRCDYEVRSAPEADGTYLALPGEAVVYIRGGRPVVEHDAADLDELGWDW